MAEIGAAKKLFLIDAMSLVFRAFYAPMQMALVSPSGLPTKAVYIFLRTLRKLLKTHSPDYIAVAFDLTAPTFRDKLFEKYKANRPTFPEDLSVQLPYVRRFCRALGIPMLEMEGFEADDVIGTLAKRGVEEGLGVVIVSGDEDLFQLVNKNVQVIKPSRGPSDDETLCDETKVKEILGVEPSQVVDWLALTGDTSDNIPGARPLPGRELPALSAGETGPGGTAGPAPKKRSYIGPKGATELILRFGTLEKVLENLEKVERQSYREALRDYRREALLSRELATIRTDVPLDHVFEELKLAPRQVSDLIALCQELGFSSLLKEFLAEAPPTRAAVTAAPTIEAEEITSRAAFERWLEPLEARAPLSVGFTVEGEEGFAGRLGALAFSDGKRLAAISLSNAGELLDAVNAVLADYARPKVVHNSKLLRLLLRKGHGELRGVSEDTMLYSYLVDPQSSSHALEEVALRRLPTPVGRPASRATESAERTRQLAGLLAPEIVRQGLRRLYEEMELPLASVLADVEGAGVRVDPAILADMSGTFERELTDLTREIYNLAGQAFDIDSPRQLGEIFFEKLKLPGGKKLRKSGQYSTEAAVLESLAEAHELPRKILDYRTRAKLKSTYIDALPKYIDPETGRIHTSFNQAGSRTGRLSSSNPNLQNIPIGDEFGQRIRSAFVAAPGARLIAADYSQIELRVLAHVSEDPLLIDAFTRNEDIHSRTAQELFGVTPALQTREHRRVAKAINYGVIYGLSSFGLSAKTGTSKAEAQQYIDEYFKRYRHVKTYLDGVVEGARSTGRVRTLFGRVRPIPEITSRDVTARNRSEREAMNTPMQGTAADLLKLAMVKVHRRLERERMQTRMILTVHDELVFEAPEAEVESAQIVVKQEMENAFAMKVPLRVDMGTGKNWKEAK